MDVNLAVFYYGGSYKWKKKSGKWHQNVYVHVYIFY